MFIPVSEETKVHGQKSSGKRMRSRHAIATAVFSIVYSCNALSAPPAVNTLPTAGVITSGAGSINTNAVTAAMTVDQTTKNMIINWGTFNIGAMASVNFTQHSPTNSVLNRIGSTGGLSQIYGNLHADGQVYIINPNGILFGNGSTVNVNSLIASSLNITDDLFNKGFLSITNGDAAFAGSLSSGYVKVENEATLTSASGGKIMMFAPNIENNGLIYTPDGQTLLAAGQKVYLAASSDPNLRGLLVEVDSGGTTTNANLGNIIAERGNITLAGIAVNQDGRLKATTSVTLNGSVKIQARDTTTLIDATGGTVGRAANVAGDVVLGANSITEVLPELSDKSTVLDGVSVQKSTVNIAGKSLHLMNDALIIAPSGNVSLIAGLDPSISTITPDGLATANTSRIYFENGSGIDVSGVGSGSQLADRLGESATQVSVANNVVLAELRSSELRDSPLQRSGILSKAKVYVDSQAVGLDGSVGTSVADVSGYISQIGHSVGERLATGGAVYLQSEGDVIFSPTATINVSGGKIDYLAGTVNKTKLLASNGQIYDIANASKDLEYIDIQNVSVQQRGYTSGKDAGSVLFSAPKMVLEGKLKGDTITGARQRSLSKLPQGAKLQVGMNQLLDGSLRPLANTNVLHSDIVFDGITSDTTIPVFGQDFDSLTADNQQTLHLGSNFTPSGFSSLKYLADGQIVVKNGVNITTNPGGSITLNGGGVDVKGNLSARGGTISIASNQKDGYIASPGTLADTRTGNVVIEGTSKLDVSGKWVNDTLNPTATETIVTAGGKISISASTNKIPSMSGQLVPEGGNVILDKGSILNASGGAWLNSGGKIASGNGGDISLKSSGGLTDQEKHTGKLILDGTLSADSFAKGGSLSMTSGSVTIGSNSLDTNGETLVDPSLFQKGGFTSYSLTAYEGLTLEDNTSIEPTALTRKLDSGFSVQQSGEEFTGFSHLELLPAANAALTRSAANLSLSATTQTAGNLTLGLGSKVVTDPGASITLTGNRQLTILGSIIDPSGSISISQGGLPGPLNVFFNNQTLWLGSNSLLDVSGVADSFINTNGFRVGAIKDAGNILLKASGEVVAESGAQLKANGTQAEIDVKSSNVFVKKNVASKGGNLSISGSQGIMWDATMNAHGGNDSVASGSLSISLPTINVDVLNLVNVDIPDPKLKFPTGPREIVLKATGTTVPVNLHPGDEIDLAKNGLADVFIDKIQNAEFDKVTLSSGNNIRMPEDITLKTRGAITLDSPNITLNDNAHALLASSYVSIGYNNQDVSLVKVPVAANTGVTSSLTVNADYIDLFGKQSLSDTQNANFFSKSDIQLRGVLPLANKSILTPTGLLQTAGNINLSAETIYPSTISEYTLSSIGKDSTIAFHQNASSGGVPFSVLGTLNVVADNIIQDGVLRAPLGVINLKAANQLTLTGGSLTSVSAQGETLPFGTTTNGTSWTFDLGDRQKTITNLPDKAVNLGGKLVNADVGSIVDVSGGGDLSAWEFTTGTGGSNDVLSASGIFAIMPDLKAGYMFGNSEAYSNSTLKPGDSIYLSGGNGLPAGNYVLLPAHYALLPGAYSVKTVAGTQDYAKVQNILNKDGSMIVSGYLTQFGGVTTDSRSSGFLVASGDIARTQSEFTSTLATNFFKADSTASTSGLRLPTDAGRVAISAVTNLVLDGNVIGKHSTVSRGSEVNISSDNIAISGDGSQESGYLTLSSDKLNAIGAESLTIGARTSSTSAGTKLDVVSNNIKLIGGASLTGQEITLVATDTVSMAGGTSVNATGAAVKNSSALIIGNADTGVIGDGALLRVSTGEQRDLVRKNISQTIGTLDIKSGAKVSATKSVIADATKTNSVNGDITLADDAAIRLGAPKISFGTSTAPVDGLLLDNNKLVALGNVSNIQLKSYSSIDFYGETSIGSDKLKSLMLESTGLAGFNNAGKTVTLTADTVKFANPDKIAFAPTSILGSGTLIVNAGKEIGLGNGTFSTVGFSKVNLKGDQIVGEAKGMLDVTGDLNIDAGRITAAGLSDQTIKASGNLVTAKHDVTTMPDKSALGGKLTLVADTIIHGGIIDTPSGSVTLKSNGTSGGDSLVLLENSQINVQGSAKILGTVAALADGGVINLRTFNGNLRMDRGAILEASATGGAGAGMVAINTTGTATLAGTLNGAAVAGNMVDRPTQGIFELTAGSVTDFKALNTELERGNFNESRNIHVAKGNLDIGVADTVTAHNVTLTTDDGDLNVAGTINGNGTKGGIVNLNAGQQAADGKGNITLASTAIINASVEDSVDVSTIESAGSKGDGGKVILNTSTDSDTSPFTGSRIIAAKGSLIDVSGKSLGSDGEVVLRSPRLGITSATSAGNQIAVSQLGSTVIGTNASILVEGVKVYKNTTLDSAFISTMIADNASYLASANSILTNLGLSSDTRFVVVSGNEVRSAGSITVANDIDLHGGGPGALTLRAKGNVNVNANISAGFTSADTSGELSDGGAWTYRITAGADLNSADVLATNYAGTGNFTLASGKLIRTGKGNINIYNAGDFNLADATSAIYTAGELDTKDYKSTLGNFTDPTVVNAAYAINGGDITLASKGNINGAYSAQLPADWLFRQGGPETEIKVGRTTRIIPYASTSWWTYFNNFNENIGALSGGDVNISAGHAITDLSAVIATNGRVFGTNAASGKLVENGGGDLKIKAGSDISGGIYMVDKGSATIRAGGSLKADSGGINTAFALGDGKIDVTTLGNLDLISVFNPTLTGMSVNNLTEGLTEANSFFSTYSDNSAVTLTSVAGGVDIKQSAFNTDLSNQETVDNIASFFPGTLKVSALAGDLKMERAISMVPSANGNLELATNNSLKFIDNAHLIMSDMDSTSVPSALNPTDNMIKFIDTLSSANTESSTFHAATPVHQADRLPSSIYAGLDIVGNNLSVSPVSLNLPKAANISAGRDIIDMGIVGQNLIDSDVSNISAGRDIVYTPTLSSNGGYTLNFQGITWGGPGYLDIAAGRNISLSNANGIVTRGNLLNPFLPDAGANLSILVGAEAADDVAFIAKYLDPAVSPIYKDALISFVQNATGSNSKLSSSDAWTQFKNMDSQLQHQFVQNTFFNELKQAGIEHNNSTGVNFGSYKRGFDAIATYFPNGNYDGKLDLSFSQVKTERGGDLDVMAPGGGVVVGLPKIPPSLIVAKGQDGQNVASRLGMFTVKGGNINVFTNGNIDVAQSREFTIAGGDILDWSTKGDIDAGKGSKTATSAPPPLIRTDSNGNTFTDLSGVVSGSGIGTLQTLATAPVGNVYLIAPSGAVNAGDAGIRSSGNLLVAAQRVIGADNISVGGASSGVPAVSSANVSFNAPVSADSSSSNKQGDQLGAADKLGQSTKLAALPSVISVEVISLGDESTPATKPEISTKKCKDGSNKKDCAS
jgi:filamentous hemagglutinin family protein